MSPRSNWKPALDQWSTSKKHVTLRSCKLEPAIWSRDTGQRIPCFDRCQLIITWMSNIKEVHGKPKLHVSVTYYLEYGRHVGQLRHRCRHRRCRRAYTPTSNTASHDNHEKINSWVSFSFLYEYGAPLIIVYFTLNEKKMEVRFLLLHWQQATQSMRTWHDYSYKSCTVVVHDMITCDLEFPWHDYCIICS